MTVSLLVSFVILIILSAVDEKQADILNKLKTNVEELKASFEETSKSLSTLEDNKGNLSENIEELRTKFSDRIQKLSDSMAQSTLGNLSYTPPT